MRWLEFCVQERRIPFTAPMCRRKRGRLCIFPMTPRRRSCQPGAIANTSRALALSPPSRKVRLGAAPHPMDHGPVTLDAELRRQPPHLPLAEANLLGGLLV